MVENIKSIWQVLKSPLPLIPGTTISILLLIQAILIILTTILFARIFIRILERRVFKHYNIKEGIQDSIFRIINYIFIVLGIIIALDHLGINMTTLAAFGAVLMVGIGFGLQNITSNFISGLILLFERPIQVGDFVEVSGVLGKVSGIKARSTTINTVDNISIIVPNSQFVSESLTNWSYKDIRTRLHVRVGVSYGSDVELVRDVLLKVGEEHQDVLKTPAPKVLFYEFGDSSLNFDLLIWTDKPLNQLFLKSDINFAIVKAFREEDIKIPYPQRDLHVISSIPIKTE
ncbi:mechanosensitive ion channel family protein [Candidatus Latescibacterota bacterium]